MLAKLGDIANVYNGKTPARSEQRDIGHPVLKIRDVDEFGNFRGKFNSFVDKTFANTHSAKKIIADDIFILNAAHNADYVGSKTFFAANEVVGALPTGEWTIIRATPNQLLPKYFYFWLSSIHGKSAIKQIVRGIHLYPSDVANIKIPLPPLPEQERIVRLLDEAESLRATRERANIRMEQFVPALFHEMFGDPAKTEFPIKTLNEVADVVSGIAKGRKFNGQKPVTINYLRVANVQAGYLDLSEIKTIEALPSEVEGLQVRIGDVLLTEGGDFDKLGRGAMLEVDLPNCIHQNHVFRARVNQDYLLPVFFHDYLQTQQAKKYFLSCAKKTTNLASINLTQLRALPVPLPPLALQREFAARVGEARGVQSAQGKSAGRVEALYQSMLSRAFAGEL